MSSSRNLNPPTPSTQEILMNKLGITIIILFAISCTSADRFYYKSKWEWDARYKRIASGEVQVDDYYHASSLAYVKSEYDKTIKYGQLALKSKEGKVKDKEGYEHTMDHMIRSYLALDRYDEALKFAQKLERNSYIRANLESKTLSTLGKSQQIVQVIESFFEAQIATSPAERIVLDSRYAYALYLEGKKEKAKDIALKSMSELIELERKTNSRFRYLSSDDEDQRFAPFVLVSLYLEFEDYKGASKILAGKSITGILYFNKNRKKIVQAVIPNSPADYAKVEVGDELLGLRDMTFHDKRFKNNGFDFHRVNTLDRLLNPGSFYLEIKRNGRPLELQVHNTLSPNLFEYYPKNYTKILTRFKKKGRYQDYIEFLIKNPDADNRLEAANLALKKVNKRSSDAFSKYAEVYRLAPEAEAGIPPHLLRQVKYLSIGPNDLNIAIIKSSLKQGVSEALLITKIKGSNAPYKNFSIEEVNDLRKDGISQDIIQAMIEVTLQIEKEQKKKKQEQQALASSMTEEESLQDSALNAISDCIQKKAAQKACDKVPGFGGMACHAALKLKYDCPL